MFDIASYVKPIPQDKANHVFFGSLVTVVVYALLHFAKVHYSVLYAALFCFLLGALKEASDAIINKLSTGDYMKGPHGVELLDAVATWVGGGIALLPLVISRM